MKPIIFCGSTLHGVLMQKYPLDANTIYLIRKWCKRYLPIEHFILIYFLHHKLNFRVYYWLSHMIFFLYVNILLNGTAKLNYVDNSYGTWKRGHLNFKYTTFYFIQQYYNLTSKPYKYRNKKKCFKFNFTKIKMKLIFFLFLISTTN